MTFSSFDCLPVEILVEIFQYIVEDDEAPLNDPRQGPLLVAQVCEFWRTTALSNTGLWTSFYLHMHQGDSGAASHLYEYLSRARNVIPFLRLTSDDNVGSHPLVGILSSLSSRIQNLEISVSNSMYSQFTSSQAPFFSLQNVTINLPMSVSSSLPITMFHNAPCLRTVHLQGDIDSISLPWSQLFEVMVDEITPEDITKLLRECTSLKRLSVRAVSFGGFFSAHPELHQNLQTLELNSDTSSEIDDVLSCLTLPALQVLLITNLRSDYKWASLPVERFLLRSGCSLNRLSIDSAFYPDFKRCFVQVLSLCPALADIHIGFSVETEVLERLQQLPLQVLTLLRLLKSQASIVVDLVRALRDVSLQRAHCSFREKIDTEQLLLEEQQDCFESIFLQETDSWEVRCLASKIAVY